MASYRKRKKDGKWEYRIKYKDIYTGKTREKSHGGFDRKADAQLAAEKIQAQLTSGLNLSDNPAFKICIDEWFESVKPNYRFNSQRMRLQSIKRIEKSIGNIPIKQISAKIITKYLQERSQDGLSTSSINGDYGVIKKTIDQALRNRLIDVNPLDGVVKPKTKPQKKARFWTLDDLNHFIKLQSKRINELKSKDNTNLYYVLSVREMAVICILAGAGTRIGELCGLLTTSYHKDTRTLDIHHNFVATTFSGDSSHYTRTNFLKTESGYRTVPLPDIVVKSIEDWLSVRSRYLEIYHQTKDDGSMFPSPYEPRAMSTAVVRDQVTKIIKNLNLPMINVHGFRHTYASLLLDANVSPKRAQVLLGHKDISTTLNVYTHVSEKEKLSAVDQLNDLLNNNLPKIT